MNVPDLIFEKLVSFFGLIKLKLFDADPGSCQPWIRDKHHGSATLKSSVSKIPLI